MNGSAIRIPLSKWAAWDGKAMREAGQQPDLRFVEPLLRRRLSPLARAALHVAHQCAAGCEAVRFVYASRHGELDRTVELLQALAEGAPLSPTTFGLSVLNSTAGLYSIARRDRSPATAIAAGAETFAFGLLEAHARATLEAGPPVLYVYADAPAATPLGPQGDDAEDIIAVALLIEPGVDSRLTMACDNGSGTPADGSSQAMAFLPCLAGARPAAWTGDCRRWSWSLQ